MATIHLWVNGVELDCDLFHHRIEHIPLRASEHKLVLKKGDISITCTVQAYRHTVTRDGTEAHSFACLINEDELRPLKK